MLVSGRSFLQLQFIHVVVPSIYATVGEHVRFILPNLHV